MPCQVSLLELVRIADTKPLWPAEFRELVDQLEAQSALMLTEDEVADRTLWGAIADWCKEHDEPFLERGFRYVFKRTAVSVERKTYSSSVYYTLVGLSSPWQYGISGFDGDTSTLVGAVAKLAVAIRKQLEDLE